MQQKHYIWIACAAGALLGFGGWLLFTPKTAGPTGPSGPAGSTAVSTTTNGVSITGDATVTEVSTTLQGHASTPPPAVQPLVFSADLSADAKAALQTQYTTLSTQLKTAPTRVDLWLELGVVYKIAGQYNAAATVWTFVAKAGPTSINYVAYGNLGDLYLNFTRDYVKAEASYKAALAINPNNADFQAGLKAAQQAQ